MTAGRHAVDDRQGMASATASARIAAHLREILEAGLDLTPETLSFIDSTFSHPSAAELAAILGDDAAPERDSLLELLFSPDEDLQLALEDFLDARQEASPAPQEVLARLAAAPLTAVFRFPDGRGTLAAAMTAELARRMVFGLRIDRALPAAIAAVIDACAAGCSGRRLRVMLRNARFDFRPTHEEFLCALIPKLDVQDEDGRECLAFALELLSDLGASADLCAALAARKKWLIKAVHHGERLREHLKQSNFETLLSRGQRLTWVDEALARRQIGFVDRIGVAVFGCTVPVDVDDWRQTIAIEGLPNVADLMRRLS
jgi:hypothetical protein